jgi:dienelactone hydrolase
MAALAVSSVAGFAGAAEPAGNTKDLFAYDYSRDFNLKEHGATTSGDVLIRDIDYASYKDRHGRIKAYLVRPKEQDSDHLAGVVFFHWLGEKKSDRTEFVDDAVDLARLGTVCLLIQGFFPWSEAPIDGQTDRQRIIDQTIEVRRAVDLLLLQPGVDPTRIGVVGHDYGAMYCAITAGVEHRAKAYVLMAGTGSFADWSLKYWKRTAKNGEQAYREAVKPLAPAEFVKLAAPASLLFQFSNKDKYISRAEAESFFQAASEPKTVKWYDVDHQLEGDSVSRDRADWLSKQLGLTRQGAPPESFRRNDLLLRVTAYWAGDSEPAF